MSFSNLLKPVYAALFALSFLNMGCTVFAETRVSVLGQSRSEVTVGDGDINLVLVHGIAANKETWSRVVEQLRHSGKYKIYLVDLLGHGSFDSKYEKLTPEVQASFLNSFIEEKNISNPVIVGHSYGGIVALLTQILFPADDRRLVLVNSPIYQTEFPFFVQYFRSSFFRGAIDVVTSVEARVKITLKLLYYDEKNISNEIVQLYTKLLSSSTHVAGISNSAQNIKPNALVKYVRKYRDVAAPFTFVRSANDSVTQPNILDSVRSDFSNASVFEISRCGHNAHEECPVELSDIISKVAGAR